MKRLLAVLAVAATLLLGVPNLAVADDFGDLCTGQTDCTYTDPSGSGDFGIPGSFIAFFVLMFVLMLVAGIVGVTYRIRAARALARRAGLDEGTATALAMLDENGLSAAYVASALRDRSGTPSNAASAKPRPTAERLAELQALQNSGAITESEYAARRQAIIDSV